MPNEKGFIIKEIMEKDVNRTNHILGIAINEYKDCPKLNNAVKDVQNFIDLMRTRFAFEEENIDFLKDEMATGSNIIRKLDELSYKLTPNDNLIIYFSGHGALHPKRNKGYWIPIDAKQDDYFTYVANTIIKEQLGDINAHHIFLIADSCFSGALFTKGARDVGKRLEKNPSRWGLTSGQKEIVLDGEPGENSPFAKSLLYHLENTTQPLSVQELCSHVLETTAANAVQTPLGEPLQVKGHKNGQFVFRLKKDEIRDWAKAQKVGTVVAMQQFLAIYPDGQFAATAKTTINNIKAENAWKRIENSTRSVDFARYRRNFPNSKYHEEAKKRLYITEEDEEWRKAKRANKIMHYERYLEFYPKGRYVAEANAGINKILNAEQEAERQQAEKEVERKALEQDNAAWQKALSINTITGFQTYLNAYPVGQNAAATRQKIKNLERQAAEKKEAEKAAEQQRLLEQKRLADEKAKKERQAEEERKQKASYGAGSQQMTQSHLLTDNNKKIVFGVLATILLLVIGIRLFSGNEENPDVTIDDSQELVEQAPVQQTEQAAIEQPTITTPSDASDIFTSQMVKIPSGSFQMGSNDYDSEKPVHTVNISSFYMSKYEVTQKQWRAIMGQDPPELRFKGCDECPVENVSWNDIQEFIKKLNTKTGKKYRLPTESEWEYAARGGQSYKYAGSDNIGSVAWYDDNSDGKTHSVGKKTPNGYGLYDMSGNVWEWCQDVWNDNYNGAPTNGSAWMSGGNNSRRVLRGGSWLSIDYDSRVAFRYGNLPSARYYSVGFRLARGI
ncbi:MAG: SUMF1/EgtB/PvdO family nonheme iron enzyme [Saprospiraceae bacterium]